MKRFIALVILAILLVGLVILSLSCAPQTTLEISAPKLDNGVMIKNVGNVDCLVFVSSPEGEQQFELAVGQNTTVADIRKPTDVSAVSLQVSTH